MRILPIFGLLGHSFKSTLSNLGFAFHISWPWMLAILPFNIAGNIYGVLNQPAAPGEVVASVLIVSLAIGLLTMVAFASIAVSWHRYILLDEVPHGWDRLRLDATVWRYFGNTILMILILFAGGLAIGIPVGIVIAILSYFAKQYVLILAIPAYLAMGLAAISYSYRFGIKLPGIALNRQDYTFRNALSDSAGNFWRFAGLGILVGLVLLALALVVGVPTYFITLSQNQGLLYVLIAVQLAVNWVATIWTVTMLTSQYGYFVEKRNF